MDKIQNKALARIELRVTAKEKEKIHARCKMKLK